MASKFNSVINRYGVWAAKQASRGRVQTVLFREDGGVAPLLWTAQNLPQRQILFLSEVRMSLCCQAVCVPISINVKLNTTILMELIFALSIN